MKGDESRDELRILIPSRNAGSIIGKGGSNITRLRTENKATISVPDCPGPERLITIGAEETETTFTVLAEVVPLLEEGGRRGGEVVAGGGAAAAGGVEARLLLHHTQVGCIIGKGGGKIKELRESSGAHIKVYGSCCPRSTDRVVAVSASAPALVLDALRQIVALAADSPVKGMSEQYDPHNYDELYASQYGGFGESRGYGGAGGGGGGDRYRPRLVPPGRGGGRYRNGRPGGRHRSGGSNGGRGDGGGDDFSEERTTNQVTIPKEYAGAIIGKGGSRIRRIRAESGASITIDEALPGATDRIITIGGAPAQIRMAQYLLQQSVKDHGGSTKGGLVD